MSPPDPVLDPTGGKTAGVIAPPPLLVGAVLLLCFGLDHVLPFGTGGNGIAWAIGIVLITVGLALDIWCAVLFRLAGTNVPPWQPSLALVTTGPYRFSRNPVYVGLLLIFFGAGLLLGTYWVAPALPFLIWLLDVGVVRREERYLLSIFGDGYQKFLNRTRRWI